MVSGPAPFAWAFKGFPYNFTTAEAEPRAPTCQPTTPKAPAPPAPFKVGDVVRGRVVDCAYALRTNSGELDSDKGIVTLWYQHEKQGAHKLAARTGGTVVRVAVVEVSEGETK